MSEVQITHRLQQHQLTNAQVWSADSGWLVYDLRPSAASFTSATVEQVCVKSGEVREIYRAERSAHVGVISAHPQRLGCFVCIHGPEDPDDDWHYDFHHRRGVLLEQGRASNIEACDITPPFTLGALRGGTHVHMFSPQDDWISFTYNDHVMHQRSLQEDQRNVGIAIPHHQVQVTQDHPREYSGSHFCLLVTATTLAPVPGSDEILRAFEEAWVGQRGYLKADGTWQRWALAFIGETVSLQGVEVAEVFIVDLPEQFEAYHSAGNSPIAGTTQRLPAPPLAVKQRRLTFGAGVALSPRHWLRSSADGKHIAFLMADDQQVVQLWTISPNGGEPQQLTTGSSAIQSAFTWHPAGTHIAFIRDNSVQVYALQTRNTRRLTVRTATPPCADAVVWSPNGKKIAFMRQVAGYQQLFTVDFTE